MRPGLVRGGLSAVVLWVSLAATGRADEQPVVVIGNGEYAVTINEYGTVVGLPAEGLVATYGPFTGLYPGTAEWWGVSFATETGTVEAVAPGIEPDWGGRLVMEPVSIRSSGTRAVVELKLRDLKATVVYEFDRVDPAALLVFITFENTGPDTLSQMLVTREWRTGRPGYLFPGDLEVPYDPPADICAVAWTLDAMPPGRRTAVTFAYVPAGWAEHRMQDEVPLELLRTQKFPDGIPVGRGYGASMGDFDADGHLDFFSAYSRDLWKNQFDREEWRRYVIDEIDYRFRYGSSFGDYDNDGLIDIATEPRGAEGLILLKNHGSFDFEDVTAESMDVIPDGYSETLCWVDTDFDANLDFILPVYPPWASGPGNFFLRNLGPGSNGKYTFTEMVHEAGLYNPPGSAKPEGAEFCDVDFDGDPDFYCNGHLYQCRSTPGVPLFAAMSEAASGIQFSQDYDEGCAFFDYDMDGDFDLAVAYCVGGHGVRLFENRGDGHFFLVKKSVIDSPDLGLCLGLSKGDWDNDGDVDFTTKEIFRRNMFVETGERHFTVATHSIPPEQIIGATPCWGDHDLDGDLDCLIGNMGSEGHYYENVLYGEDTPDDERRFVRVRVMRDSETIERGLETEYGAVVRILVHDEGQDLRRVGVVSSAGGYVNQNEYVLHFALPPDPFPDDPARDVVFDVQVDFLHDPSSGFWRVDRLVNPELGNVDLADLNDREIAVFRSGRVNKNGCRFGAVIDSTPRGDTSTGGLALSADDSPLPDPTPSPADDWYVGVDFDTSLASSRLHLVEVLFDGKADLGSIDKIALWDVTQAGAPVRVLSSAWKRFARNHRSYVRVDAPLEPHRRYRLVGRVSDLRPSPITAPDEQGPLTTHGGLSFQDLDPDSGANVESAALEPTQVYAAVRVRVDPGSMWADHGYALAGTHGELSLEGQGALVEGEAVALSLSNGLSSVPTLLFCGMDAACFDVAGGVMLPVPDFVFIPRTDQAGTWTLSGTFPPGCPPGHTMYFQVWSMDAAGPQGWAASNALSATTPY